MMCQRFVIHQDRLPFRKAVEWTVLYYLKRLMSQYIDGSISCFVPTLVAIEKKHRRHRTQELVQYCHKNLVVFIVCFYRILFIYSNDSSLTGPAHIIIHMQTVYL